MDERLKIIDVAFNGDGIVGDVASLLKLLCERGHIRDLISIIDEFQAMYKFESGISTAYVTSAVELSDDEKQLLCANLEKKLARRIELVCSVDHSIVGGLVIRVDDKIIDGSIKGRLSELRRMMERCEQHNEPQTR